jgi:hypothetical protein
MEQRINTLEEEIKLLKNQVRSVLLDIKENLSFSDWQLESGLKKEVGPREEAGQLSREEEENCLFVDNSNSLTGLKSIPAVVPLAQDTERDPAGGRPDSSPLRSDYTKDCAVSPEAPGHSSNIQSDRCEYDITRNGPVSAEHSREQHLDPLTLVMLLKWLERCQASLGKECAGTLLEIYAAGKNLPESTRQVLRLLPDLMQKDNGSGITVAAVPLLLELDEIFRPHREQTSFQKMVLKMLLQTQAAEAINRL